MTTDELNKQIGCAEYELLGAFQQRMALACRAFANAELALDKTPDETAEDILRAYSVHSA